MGFALIKKKDKLGKDILFKISRFKEIIKKTTPHKHEGYFELILLYEGAGFHWVDTEKLQVEPPMVHFLTPGQLHCWELTKLPKGFVILFKEEFFDYIKQVNIFRLVRELERAVVYPVSEDMNLKMLFLEVEKEFLKSGAYSHDIIQGLIQVILARLLQADTNTHLVLDNNHKVYSHFRRIIQKGAPAKQKVKEIAEQLHVSPQNLNALCRKIAGNSAGGLIKEQVIMEAKRYLLHTDLTVSQIAFQLNFAAP